MSYVQSSVIGRFNYQSNHADLQYTFKDDGLIRATGAGFVCINPFMRTGEDVQYVFYLNWMTSTDMFSLMQTLCN